MSVTRKVDSIKGTQPNENDIESLKAENAKLAAQVTDLQNALCEVYEIIIGG